MSDYPHEIILTEETFRTVWESRNKRNTNEELLQLNSKGFLNFLITLQNCIDLSTTHSIRLSYTSQPKNRF